MRKKGLPPIHPGEFLAEILAETELSQAEFARRIGVTPMHISHIVSGRRRVTAELALLFAKAFGQSAEYWLNLQAAFDLQTAKTEMQPRLKNVRRLVTA